MEYYSTEERALEVRIELPVGSYTPVFHWDPIEARSPITKKMGFPTIISFYLLTIALTALVTSGVFVMILNHKRVLPASAVDEFWAPLFKTPQPVLICLPSPVVYEPSENLFKRYVQTHPGTYQTLRARWGSPLSLDPDEKVPWKDLVPDSNMYVLREDSYAAAQMLLVFDRIGKPSQVKSLNALSIRDLRNSPAVLIGAFNNRWTLELTGNLLFTFDEGESKTIREQVPPGRVWSPHYDKGGRTTRDYAIISRLTSSSTGQVLIVVAGVNPQGTEAAGEFLSHADYLASVLRSAPHGWEKMDFQAVLQTDVTDEVAGPPKVVATRYW